MNAKTVVNVLTTLRSMLTAAKKWGYVCSAINMRELTLPAEEVKEQARSYTPEEVRRILAAAPEPYKTMFYVAAMCLARGRDRGLARNAALDALPSRAR